MRTSMTTLTQTWMTLQLSNVLPSDHNSDLPLPKCQLVYAILTQMSVHVAQVIADTIYLFAGMPPTRHPLDPDKSNRARGFLALITGLCQSFMDGFSDYNQIKMAPEDMEKTTFVTLWGTFYYEVMSFGLQNAGATYQRAMVGLFHDMMHR